MSDSDREATLRALADDLRGHEGIRDAWLAKSFTDRLLVIDVRADAELPAAVRERLADRDLRGANDVYDADAADPSFAGDVGDAERHQFVDVRTRGDHRSYVYD
jgi:hypothetical protein